MVLSSRSRTKVVRRAKEATHREGLEGSRNSRWFMEGGSNPLKRLVMLMLSILYSGKDEEEAKSDADFQPSFDRRDTDLDRRSPP